MTHLSARQPARARLPSSTRTGRSRTVVLHELQRLSAWSMPRFWPEEDELAGPIGGRWRVLPRVFPLPRRGNGDEVSPGRPCASGDTGLRRRCPALWPVLLIRVVGTSRRRRGHLHRLGGYGKEYQALCEPRSAVCQIGVRPWVDTAEHFAGCASAPSRCVMTGSSSASACFPGWARRCPASAPTAWHPTRPPSTSPRTPS